ncbi:hypothetical protein HPB48_017351 [Haemaphysalis longicornis]|uniref:Uncharacterized protein n=1 Tax=Haemaphysalis longicornis TaxID=44386 RepID=A0A9J6GLH3_HAELO|nr:hypothetical protein HPB48_017351 [Haemaphysalis longicornis]
MSPLSLFSLGAYRVGVLFFAGPFAVPKRPTSSGGFSSARSERSDSSVSLCGDPPPGGSPAGPGSGPGAEAASQAKSGGAVVCNGSASNGPSGGQDGANDVGHSKAATAIAAAKGPAKKTFGRAVGKQPAASSIAKAPTSHAETLNRAATRRPTAASGQPRPVSSGHELASHVVPDKFPTSKTQEPKPVANGTIAVEEKKQQPEPDMNCAQANSPGSGIPKPTAAVKGTTKQSREDLTSIGTTEPEKGRNELKPNGSSPAERIVDAKASDVSSISDDADCQKERDQTTSSANDTNVRTETLPKSERSKKAQAQNVSIAMVSPIMSSQHSFSKDSVTASSTESSLATIVSVKEEKSSCSSTVQSEVQQSPGQPRQLPRGQRNRRREGPPGQGLELRDGPQRPGQQPGGAAGRERRLLQRERPRGRRRVHREVSAGRDQVGAEGEQLRFGLVVCEGRGEVEEALANIPPMQPLARAAPYGSGYSRGLAGHRTARLPACLRLQVGSSVA